MEKLKVLIIEPRPEMLFRAGELLKKKHDVSFAISCHAILNCMKKHENEGGLDYYDVVIMEPYFNPYPLFGYHETQDSLQTGYFLYDKYMRGLTKTKVIILTYPVEQYHYGPCNFPDRHWGANVFIHSKYNLVGNEQCLINMVESPELNQPIFVDKE